MDIVDGGFFSLPDRLISMKPLNSLIATFVARDVPWHIALVHDWKIIVGDLAEHMRCEKVDGGCVTIGVYDPRWMQELYCMQHVIMERMNQHFGAHHVRAIRFVLTRGDLSKKITNREKKVARSEPIKKRPLSAHEQRALEKITDDQLRASLTKFLIRCDP